MQQLAARLDAGTGGSLLEARVRPGPTLQEVHGTRPEMAQQDGLQHPGLQEGATCHPAVAQPPLAMDWLDAFAAARAVRLYLVSGAGLMPPPASASDHEPAAAALGALRRWLVDAASRLPALPAIADGASHVKEVGAAKQEEERSVLRVAVQALHAHGAAVRLCVAATRGLEEVHGLGALPGRPLAGSADVTQHKQAARAAAAGGADIWALFGRRLLDRLPRDPRSALSSAHLARSLAPLQQLAGGRQSLIVEGLSEIEGHLRDLVAGARGADVWLKQAAGRLWVVGQGGGGPRGPDMWLKKAASGRWGGV